MARTWELDESDLPTLRKLRTLWRTAEKIERGWCARWTARTMAVYFEKTVERVERSTALRDLLAPPRPRKKEEEILSSQRPDQREETS
jgi:hypothetical protein